MRLAHTYQRALAASLATLVFWAPMARSVARAQDAADGTMSVSPETLREASTAIDARAQLDQEEDPYRVRLPVEDRDLDWGDLGVTDEPAESGASETVEDQGPVNPLSLPSGPAKTAVTPQQISLPKGEGSIQGMGESFTPNLSSGTGTFSVPIALPKGRNGVGPSFALSYSTSGGNGVVGIGWSLAAPFISRQTDKGLPRYRDESAWSEDEDRFMYNGGQELVPVDNRDGPEGSASVVPTEFQGFQQYRARVEGAFMRFFRSPDRTRWVVQSKDGTRFDFGLLPSIGQSQALQSDPEDSTRMFAWYLSRMSDVHGSVVHYRYSQDEGQVYLADVYYDSPASCAVATVAGRRDCSASFSQYGRHVRFVYESRADVTTSYTTTWRVSTAQRLKRIEVTSAQGTAGARFLVRRYHLSYDPGSFHSLLTGVQVEGRKSRYDAVLGINVGELLSESVLGDDPVGSFLPAMRFGYTSANATSDTISGFGGVDARVITSTSSPNHSADEGRVDLFDVNADGLPDLLVTDPARYDDGAGVMFNGFTATGQPSHAGAFSTGVRVDIPAGLSGTMSLSNLNIVPMDIDGDGKSDLLHMPRKQNYGYFVTSKAPSTTEYSPVTGWSFAYVKTALPQGVTDPRIDLGKDTEVLKTLDVNNDHLIDVLKTSGQHVQTWLNLGWLPGGDGRFGSYVGGGLSTEPVESCLPYSGANLDFSAPGVRIADMNGDGLEDIVQLRFGKVVYFPGRGEGAWGDGSATCDDSNRHRRHIEMENPPLELSTELAGVHMVDVNADGASDVVQLSADTMSLWFNRLGKGFTDRIVVDGLPFASETLERTRIADIDGSGTTDIINARAGSWQWIDPMGGQRPRLLETIDNGLGALTTLEYSTSVDDYLRDLSSGDFTWNDEPLAPGAASPKCDAKAQARGAGCVHRGGGSPVVSTVVRAVSTTDRMSALGAADNIQRTEYRYHNGYYEGIEQEFRGFGVADAIALGDTNGPTSVARTYFHQGRRPNAIAADRLADNPNEALKGREYLTEVSDLTGNYLSTSHATYAVRSLATGLNGVDVSYAYVKRSDELTYDTSVRSVPSGASATLSLDAVVREQAGAGLAVVTAGSAEEGDALHEVPVRNGNYARTATTIDTVDNVGNMLQQTALGRVDRSEAITSYSTPVRVDDLLCDNTGWLWRTAASWVGGAGDQGKRLKWSETRFSPCADPIVTTGHAELPTEGAFAFAGSAGTASYTQTSQNLVSSTFHDRWGQATESCAGASLYDAPLSSCLRYAKVERDLAYDQFVLAERVATTPNGAGLALLSTTAAWDPGLDALIKATDPNGLVSEVFYDGLGRTTGTIAPNVKGCEGKRIPTTRIFYDLTASPAARPMSRVHTISELSCTGLAADMLEAYAFVDGLGRVRAALSEGDSTPSTWIDDKAHAWVRSGLHTLTAKGKLWQVFHPDFFESAPSAFESVLRNPPVAAGYTASSDDAFGRPLIQINEDSTYRRFEYHALYTKAYDENDVQGLTAYLGTPTVSVQDGHGREIAQRLHQRHSDGTGEEYHFLFSYYRADGAVARVIRARAPEATVRPEIGYTGLTNWVERTFVYDTAGRRIASYDPDTDNRAGAANSRTWRYLFNTVGDLAAVRDPRGCGQNFFYDRAGRLIGEQYVTCGEAKPSVELAAGTVPAGSVGLDAMAAAQTVQVLYHFDIYPGWIGTLPSPISGVLGRATGVTDRGQRSVVAYDDRGNGVWSARQMALISQAGTFNASGDQTGALPVFAEGAERARTNAFDSSHTYIRTAKFDHGGRNQSVVLPTDPDFVAGAAPVVAGAIQYNAAGKPRSAGLSIDGGTQYSVVAGLRYHPDFLVGQTSYGDGALTGRPSTTSETVYDSRRRPRQMTTLRAPKAGAAALSLGAVTVVVDQLLDWDLSTNLTAIHDQRRGQEWPASHRPQTVEVAHDALYHVEHAYFTYTGANNLLDLPDATADWRDTEARHRTADPMHSKAAPRMGALPSARVINLNYETDWLANTTEWNDDARSFYERSIGLITNGVSMGSNWGQSPAVADPLYRPSALYFATDLDPLVPSSGYLEVSYGVSGNVIAMTAHAQCSHVNANSCRDPGGSNLASRRNAMLAGCACANEQHYSYRYDELNRLSEARRFDRVAGTWTLQARQRYRYDSANQRTIRETNDITSADTRATLYVTAGDFERRGLRANETTYAAIAGETETQYLVSGARVVWQDRDTLTPTLVDADHRITFAVGDLIQSTSAVIDLMSGELLEVTGFYPNGAREHWMDAGVANANSMPLETVGFTGKESDEEVGLAYFGERYLIPRIGRWATPDPLSIHAAGGGEVGNSYHYVSGNLLQARDPLGLKEFDSYENYANEMGDSAVAHDDMGGQGHWLTSDREDNTAVWGTANFTNLHKENGNLEYTKIAQRADFYRWFDGASKEKGHETRWAGAAAQVADLAHAVGENRLLVPLGKFVGLANDEMEAAAQHGNKIIFDDVFGKLRSLYDSNPVTGGAARAWDEKTLAEEQMLVQPMYKELSAVSVKKWELGAQQSPQPFMQPAVLPYYGVKLAPFPHTSDMRNPTHRWEYGMQGMGHTRSSWDTSRALQAGDMLHIDIAPKYLDGSAYSTLKYW